MARAASVEEANSSAVASSSALPNPNQIRQDAREQREGTNYQSTNHEADRYASTDLRDASVATESRPATNWSKWDFSFRHKDGQQRTTNDPLPSHRVLQSLSAYQRSLLCLQFNQAKDNIDLRLYQLVKNLDFYGSRADSVLSTRIGPVQSGRDPTDRMELTYEISVSFEGGGVFSVDDTAAAMSLCQNEEDVEEILLPVGVLQSQLKQLSKSLQNWLDKFDLERKDLSDGNKKNESPSNLSSVGFPDSSASNPNAAFRLSRDYSSQMSSSSNPRPLESKISEQPPSSIPTPFRSSGESSSRSNKKRKLDSNSNSHPQSNRVDDDEDELNFTNGTNNANATRVRTVQSSGSAIASRNSTHNVRSGRESTSSSRSRVPDSEMGGSSYQVDSSFSGMQRYDEDVAGSSTNRGGTRFQEEEEGQDGQFSLLTRSGKERRLTESPKVKIEDSNSDSLVAANSFADSQVANGGIASQKPKRHVPQISYAPTHGPKGGTLKKQTGSSNTSNVSTSSQSHSKSQTQYKSQSRQSKERMSAPKTSTPIKSPTRKSRAASGEVVAEDEEMQDRIEEERIDFDEIPTPGRGRE